MSPTSLKLHPLFVAEVSGIDLRRAEGGRPFDGTEHRRALRRVTTLDVGS